MGKCITNFRSAERLFNERYHNWSISRAYSRERLPKFEATGNVRDAKRSDQLTISNDEKIDVVGEIVIYSTSSSAQVTSICEVS